MRSSVKFGGMVLLSLAVGIFAGCGGSSDTAPGQANPGTENGHQEGDGHGHAGHAHLEEGPHHGQLIELGKGEYHAELVHDDNAHTVAIYLLDAKASTAVPVTESELTINIVVAGQPLQFKLPAVPLAGEAAGESSHFELSDEKLCDSLDDPKNKARFNVTIQGKPFTAAIEPHDHDHGPHEH